MTYVTKLYQPFEFQVSSRIEQFSSTDSENCTFPVIARGAGSLSTPACQLLMKRDESMVWISEMIRSSPTVFIQSLK